jgi:hypothetical protein
MTEEAPKEPTTAKVETKSIAAATASARIATARIASARIADESVPMTFVRVLGRPYLRATGLRCLASICRNFFFRQHRAAFLPGLVPVSKVDHPLDSKIPFTPSKVNIYLDFVAFWIRTVSFLLRNFGRRVFEPVRHFLESLGKLYAYAAEVYKENLSTTERPFYIARPRFLVIHLLDPHLMCIPSLHVMIVIRAYTCFRDIVRGLGEGDRLAPQAEELRQGALAITEAVLYVKQHSVNCIPAAMYAMTRFEPDLFTPTEAESFVSGLFCESITPDRAGAEEIRAYILSMYRRFLAEGEGAENWTKPLLDFLKELPLK